MNMRLGQTPLTLRPRAALGVVAALLALGLVALRGAAEEPKPGAHPVPTTAPTSQPKRSPGAASVKQTAEFADGAAHRPTGAVQGTMNIAQADCAGCHACDQPTKENPCLRMCPRSVSEVIANAAHEVLPNAVILLEAFEWEDKRFMPVPFNHKVHADMAGMAGGCEVCHHHTSQGQLHPPCRACHKADFEKGNVDEMRMPSLKGAYHRQCMGCHRNWSHNTKCSICHLPKGDQPRPITPEQVLPPGDVAGAHPPIPEPDNILQKTNYEAGPNVMFRHRDHVERYGYECERCHRGQNCSRCHEQAEKPKADLANVKAQTHDQCFSCHEDDSCERCHTTEDSPERKPFDHSATGFPLEQYHGKLSCKACHKRLQFLRELQQDCSSCHKDWKPETFNHAVTGQALDDNHSAVECRQCHTDGRFIAPPSCTECHESDVAFPARRPGPAAVPTSAPASAPATDR